MATFDDLTITVPPVRIAGTYFARCLDGSVPINDFFVGLEAELRQHSACFPSRKNRDPDFFYETAKQIERQLQLQLARLRINRDLLPGSVFRKESHPHDRRNIFAIKHELVAKQLGIRFAVYRYEQLSQWIVTHAFIKTTPAWPETEFDRIMDIMSQVKQALHHST